MDVTLFNVPIISEPIVGQPIDVCVKQNPHFKDLELADWALEVDVLIGSDHGECAMKVRVLFVQCRVP